MGQALALLLPHLTLHDNVEYSRLLKILDADEQARAARLRFESDRVRWIAAHAWLRLILGNFLDCPIEHVRIAVASGGKPYLPDAPWLRFNLSHCGELGLLALARDSEVGGDLERIRTNIDVSGIAERFFAPEEAVALAALPQADQPAAFFTLWTSKEAALKLRGEGIRAGLAGNRLPEGSQCVTLEGIHGHIAALACDEELTIKFAQLDPDYWIPLRSSQSNP